MTLSIKCELCCGDKIEDACDEAIKLAIKLDCFIEFDFNDIHIIVHKTNNVKMLVDIYKNQIAYNAGKQTPPLEPEPVMPPNSKIKERHTSIKPKQLTITVDLPKGYEEILPDTIHLVPANALAAVSWGKERRENLVGDAKIYDYVLEFSSYEVKK